MTRRFPFWLILVGWAVCIPAGTTAQTLTVGYFISEPRMFPGPTGAAAGVNIEYMKAIAHRMGIKQVTFTVLPLKRLLEDLKDGKIDASLAQVKTPEREKLYVFPRNPLYTSQPGLVVMRSGPVKKIETIDDILGIRIGYSGGAALTPFMQNDRLQVQYLYQIDAGEAQIRQLALGRIDAVFTPSTWTMAYYVKKYGDERTMTILPLPDSPVGWYTAFSAQAATRWLVPFEKALEEQSRQLPYDHFFQDWLARQ